MGGRGWYWVITKTSLLPFKNKSNLKHDLVNNKREINRRKKKELNDKLFKKNVELSTKFNLSFTLSLSFYICMYSMYLLLD